MTSDQTKLIAFLLENLIRRLQVSAIQYKALQQLIGTPDNWAMKAVLESPEFVTLRQKSTDLRKQVTQAVHDQKLHQIPGLLEDLAGELGLAPTDSRLERTL